MPRKIPFRVIYSSGWEDDYPPKDLEVHSPFIKGWRSPRYCLYPQELVLRMDPPARVRKLQLLSHQYMIASKIELHIGQLPSDTHTSIDNAQFKRLGYISLSDNEQTGYRSRELKSVNLDCSGHLIKLVLQSNHINRLNLFNQVSLVALNVIGDPSTDSSLRERVGVSSSLPNHVTHYIKKGKGDPLSEVVHSYLPSLRHSQGAAPDPIVLGTINKPSHIPLMDDLGFAVAQDPQTADLIRKLDSKKRTAVKDEEFHYAKQLKQVIDELQKIGEVLCRYEVEKKLAIEREDYDTAKEKKAQLDAIRSQVYEQLDIQGLLSKNNTAHNSGRNTLSNYQHNERSHPRVKRHPPFDGEHNLSVQGSVMGGTVSHTPISLPSISRHSNGNHTPSPPPAKIHYSDDRPLPALVAKSEKLDTLHEQQEVEDDSGGGVSGEGGVSSEAGDRPEPLTEKQLNEVPFAVEVFGMGMLEHVYSKQYYLREKGLQQILEDLELRDDVNRKETNNVIKATCQILGKALKDKVMSTFAMGLDLLNHLKGPFCQKHRLGRPDLSFIVEKVMPILLNRTGDMTPRIHTAAMDAIIELAQHQQIKTFAMIGPLLVRPFKQQKPPWRLAQSRVELLERFYHDVGLESSGVNFKSIMKFLCPLLSHSHGNVRDGAIRLVLDLYREFGNEVRQLLPVSDDNTSRKKTLWKSIFDGFDRIDGVPTQAEREAAVLAAEKTKNDEIQKLQEQVETLRQLAAQDNTMKEEELESALDHSSRPVSEAVSVNQPGPSTRDNQGASRTADSDKLDTTCVFCGEQRREFADKGMESHYLKNCPMLQSCPHCTQVIEISGLTKHWLTECEAKARFKACPTCHEAILGKQYDSHVSSCKEKRTGKGHTRCPLCHNDVQDGEEGWKSHLMGPGLRACPKNPRKKGAAVTKKAPVRRGPAGARGTMIPRLGAKETHKPKRK